MVTNFSSPIKGANAGSCQRLADYLEKENNQLAPNQREEFFCAQHDKVSMVDVVASIDQNGAAQGLKSGQDRFYTFTLIFVVTGLEPMVDQKRFFKDVIRPLVKGRVVDDVFPNGKINLDAVPSTYDAQGLVIVMKQGTIEIRWVNN